MCFHISYVSFGAFNTLFFSHNVTLLLQSSASSASKIIRRKYIKLIFNTYLPTYDAFDRDLTHIAAIRHVTP